MYIAGYTSLGVYSRYTLLPYVHPGYTTLPPYVHLLYHPGYTTPVYYRSRHSEQCVWVPGEEALGSNLGYSLGERLSGAFRTLRVLELLCPSAQSYSALPVKKC